MTPADRDLKSRFKNSTMSSLRPCPLSAKLSNPQESPQPLQIQNLFTYTPGDKLTLIGNLLHPEMKPLLRQTGPGGCDYLLCEIRPGNLEYTFDGGFPDIALRVLL